MKNINNSYHNSICIEPSILVTNYNVKNIRTFIQLYSTNLRVDYLYQQHEGVETFDCVRYADTSTMDVSIVAHYGFEIITYN